MSRRDSAHPVPATAPAAAPAAWPPWFECTAHGVRLRLHVQPGAARSAVIGPHGDRLKIALRAPPVQGRANAALLDLLGELLDLRATALTLAAGAGSRAKTIAVACPPADAAALLARLLAANP